jgi:hypothetical protein
MPERPSNPEIKRRDLLKGAAVSSVAAAVGFPARAQGTEETPIGAENRKAGTTDWQLTYTKVDPATRYRCPWIEGYVSEVSLRAGDNLQFFVSTQPSAEFKIDLYRLGYYGGKGGAHYKTLGPFKGTTQPEPKEGPNRLRECQWEPCTDLTIPRDWPTGVYLGKLSLIDDRYQSYVVFIVRDDRPADLVFQCSTNTWQAYNRWPSQFSLYDDGKSEWALGDKATISFDRPYGKYCQILDAPLSQGSGEFLLWEFPLAYWLEKEGYDVTYCSNSDVHESPDCLLRGRAFLSVGHDEYWSLEQYAHVKKAIEEGVHAAFLSGNTCCFVSPFTPGTDGRPNRTLTRTGRFGGLTKWEEGKMGPFSMEGPNEAELIGARTITPYNGSGDWIVAKADHWLFEGTGLRKGEGIPGLVGWEFHGDPATHLPGFEVVAEGEAINSGDEKAHWTATLYNGPKGNLVFNAATIWWAQGLSQPPGHMVPYSHNGRPHGEDGRVQRITRNLLARFLA